MRYTEAQEQIMHEVAYEALQKLMQSGQFKEIPGKFKNVVWAHQFILKGNAPDDKNSKEAEKYYRS